MDSRKIQTALLTSALLLSLFLIFPALSPSTAASGHPSGSGDCDSDFHGAWATASASDPQGRGTYSYAFAEATYLINGYEYDEDEDEGAFVSSAHAEVQRLLDITTDPFSTYSWSHAGEFRTRQCAGFLHAVREVEEGPEWVQEQIGPIGCKWGTGHDDFDYQGEVMLEEASEHLYLAVSGGGAIDLTSNPSFSAGMDFTILPHTAISPGMVLKTYGVEEEGCLLELLPL